MQTPKNPLAPSLSDPPWKYLQELLNVWQAVVLLQGQVEDGLVTTLSSILMVQVRSALLGSADVIGKIVEVVIFKALQQFGLENTRLFHCSTQLPITAVLGK